VKGRCPLFRPPADATVVVQSVYAVSEKPSQDRPVKRALSEEQPLTLEDSDAGSTDIVGARNANAPNPSGGSSLSSEDTSGGGATTGGFETMLGRLVVRAGLVTAEEMEMCGSLLRESSEESGVARTLQDILLDNHFLTHRQLDRVQRDFEAKKSSQRIPGYRILRKLGAGAMATVFLARQLSLDRHVAIKVLPKKFSSNERFIERFYKEGRAAAKLNHPNIVGAYDVGKAGEHHYFVMEYVDGETVYDRIVRERRIDEKAAINIIQQVTRALQHAHERGFVHRDIKPKNIMISSEGKVKLADLGLARAMSDKEAAKAEAGRAYGTPYYISPEQIRGELRIGPPADIYGLGATFYHMVTGKLPFEAKNPSAVMHKHLKEELTPPDHINDKLSGGVAQVIEMMMAKSVTDRYRNATDLLEDLDLVSEGEPPHFAHKSLDLSSMGPGLTGPATEPTVVPPPPRANFLSSNTLVTVMLVLLVASFIGNLVMLAIVLSLG
jgi:serine/threonine-protein kinase